MISKILNDFEKFQQEKVLIQKAEKVWFKKINDDNVRPLYKPFKFYECLEINEYYNDREKRKKNFEEYEKQMYSMKNTKIIFGKQYRNNRIEQDIDGVFFVNEMISRHPREIKNSYIRDKYIQENQSNKKTTDNLNTINKSNEFFKKFHFQKFEKEFRFGDLLKDNDKVKIPLIEKLKNFIIEIKNENLLKYLKYFSYDKYEDDEKYFTEKKVEDWKKSYVKIEDLKILTSEIKKIQFTSNQDYLINFLVELDKEEPNNEQNLNHSESNRKIISAEEMTNEKIHPDTFKENFIYLIRSLFTKNIDLIRKSLKNVSKIKNQLTDKENFVNILISILFIFTLEEDKISKKIVFEDSLHKFLLKYFKVSTNKHFKLFSINKIIPDSSKLTKNLIACTFIIDRDFYQDIVRFVLDDDEFKNIFGSEDMETFENLIKTKLKQDFDYLKLHDEYKVEIDKINSNNDFENVIRMYTLEGELNGIVNQYFKLDEKKRKYLVLYLLLLYYSLFRKEKSAIDCTLYRVLTLDKEQYHSFRKIKKNDRLYNNEFLQMSSNVYEAVKYFVDEKDLSNGVRKEDFNANSSSINEFENMEFDTDPKIESNMQKNENIISTIENIVKVEDGKVKKEQDYKIIFEVDVRKVKSFLSPIICDLKEYSAFPFEEEYLLSPNNIFTVTDIIMNNKLGNIITVKLDLNSNYFKDNFPKGNFQINRKNKFRNIIFDSFKFYQQSQENDGKLSKKDLNANDADNDYDIINKGKDKNSCDKLDLSTVISYLKDQSNLQEISINSINSLSKIESEETTFIGNINKLLEMTPTISKLDLSGNNLTHHNLYSISKNFENLKNLKTLILKKNSLKLLTNFSLKIEEYELKIHEIDLSFNRLNIVGVRDLTSLMKTTRLQKINLSYNKINGEGAKLIAEKFKEIPDLQYLDLSNNNLFSIDYNFEKILSKNFFQVKKLNTLLLQGCNLTSTSLVHISENISECKGLEVINFSCNRIDQYDCDGSSAFSKNFQHLTKLKYLNLGYNYIGYLGIGGLKSLLFNFKYLHNIERFMLNANSFGSMYKLFDNLRFVENLIELNLNEMKIGDEGIKELSKSFKSLVNLELLHLNSNDISSQGMVMCHFDHLENLKELNLSNNKLKSEGCSHLNINKKLEVLNLWANDIMVDGVKNFFEKNNYKEDFNLREISFSQNNIDEKEKTGKADGLIFILKRIFYYKRIRSINFSANYLNQNSFYNLIYYYPIIKTRNISLNISDCPSHSDLNNGVKGAFETLVKEDHLENLVKFSI